MAVVFEEVENDVAMDVDDREAEFDIDARVLVEEGVEGKGGSMVATKIVVFMVVGGRPTPFKLKIQPPIVVEVNFNELFWVPI